MVFVVCVTVFYLLIVRVSSWNVETTKPVTFHGDKDSYFGFSVALNGNSKGNYVLIAAPRANSSLPRRRKLHQPGAIYRYNVTSAERDFELVFEKEDRARGRVYVSMEDDMWLGVSLDVNPRDGKIMACAHLWKNQLYSKHYLANGACYVKDKEFSRTTETLLPFINETLQERNNIFLYAFGQAGSSAVFSEEGDLVLGAPGFHDWIGTVVSYKSLGSWKYSSNPVVPFPPRDQQPSPESYIGYSVTTGRFFKLGKVQFVAGAPRDSNGKGRVYIFESLESGQTTLIIKQRFEGELTGEYFGASVLGADVNNDSYTDLIVGSPLYSLRSGGDEGKVNVYMSNGMGLQKTEELMGSSRSESRFGTSIANAGDLNQDGYIDLAIGAPYEDGAGAVYIYHGNKKGISPHYAQKIDASVVNGPISGFGISISRGMDVDNNSYPDLLIGSYLSDKAFLFRTRPVVRVNASLVFYPSQINTNSSICPFNTRQVPCFNVSSCFTYDGNYVPLQLDIAVQLRSARKRDVLQPRRYLMYQNKLSSYLRKNIKLSKGKASCFLEDSYVVSDSEDFITPIQMTMTFELVQRVDTTTVFCIDCPVLDPTLPSSITSTITFQTDCGDDSACISDLKLTANVSELRSGEFIVGETNHITLSIELENQKDPAYMAEIEIHFPGDMQIINKGNCRDPSKGQINCQVGNPLRSGRTIRRDIEFDTSSIPTEFDYVEINVLATTASQESNYEDNKATIKIPLRILADITIVGKTDVEQIVFDKAQRDSSISHTYTVMKYLPSPITSVSVDMLIPTAFSKSGIVFLQLKSIGINEAFISSVPASCNFTQVDLQPDSAEVEEKKEIDIGTEIFVTPTPRRKREISRVVSKNEEIMDAVETSTAINSDNSVNYVLDCSSSICTKISCIAGPFTQKRTSASFRISGSINIATLQNILRNWDSITVRTGGKVAIVDQREDMQPENHLPDEAKVTTTLVRTTPLALAGVSFWIVAVSTAAGVILLVLVLVGMIQLGFFRRKRKEDLEKLMTQAELEEWKPYLVTDEQLEGAKGKVED